jgi:hypothetical protein
MTNSETIRFTPRLILGFGILALGILWTLDNMDLMESEPITRWWPVVLIAIGVVQLVDRRGAALGPILLTLAGIVLLADRLDLIDFSLGDFIPLAIAFLGVKLIWEAMGRRRGVPEGTADPNDTVHAFAMMAGVRHQNVSREFRGGDANAIMGGVDLDLRESIAANGASPVLDVFAFWGGVEVYVPANWRVVSNVLPLMGGYEDNTKHNGEPGPTVTIRGTAIMGAIEVKN